MVILMFQFDPLSSPNNILSVLFIISQIIFVRYLAVRIINPFC